MKTVRATNTLTSTYGAQPDTCFRPGVNFQVTDRAVPNDIVMQALPTLALACLDDERFIATGRWALTAGERDMLLRRMDTTSIRKSQLQHVEIQGDAGGHTIEKGDGLLSSEDFEIFCSNEDNIQWVVKNLPSSTHGLGCHSLMKNAFKHFDANGDKAWDENEWMLFIDLLCQLRLRYLQQMALVQFRAFFGRGQSESGLTEDTQCRVRHLADRIQVATRAELEKRPGLKKNFQCGFLIKDWKGWRADLYYYSANTHPLHGIWACCVNNRLDRSDRLMMEVAVLSYCFWLAYERELMVNGQSLVTPPWWLENDVFYRWSCVTVPSIIIYWLLFLLFTTPKCGTVDESSAEKNAIHRAKCVSSLGDVMGDIFVVALITITIVRVVMSDTAETLYAATVIYTIRARLTAYMIAWGSMVCVYFNPFIAWGSTQPGTTSLGDLIGLGQWKMEKIKMCLTVLALPDEDADLQGVIGLEYADEEDPELYCTDTLDSTDDAPIIANANSEIFNLEVNKSPLDVLIDPDALLKQTANGAPPIEFDTTVSEGDEAKVHADLRAGLKHLSASEAPSNSV